jgi:type II secretory pathway pseudopilin PulG
MNKIKAALFHQSGRSMIEMLGVLAIIGVLSVGGLAGYNMAMRKIRNNRVIEELQLVIQQTTPLMDTLSELKEGNIFPGIDTSALKQAALACSSSVQITGPTKGNVNGYSLFNFFFTNLSADLCRTLVMTDIPTASFCARSGNSCEGSVFIYPNTPAALTLCSPDEDGIVKKTILLRLFTREEKN